MNTTRGRTPHRVAGLGTTSSTQVKRPFLVSIMTNKRRSNILLIVPKHLHLVRLLFPFGLESLTRSTPMTTLVVLYLVNQTGTCVPGQWKKSIKSNAALKRHIIRCFREKDPKQDPKPDKRKRVTVPRTIPRKRCCPDGFRV